MVDPEGVVLFVRRTPVVSARQRVDHRECNHEQRLVVRTPAGVPASSLGSARASGLTPGNAQPSTSTPAGVAAITNPASFMIAATPAGVVLSGRCCPGGFAALRPQATRRDASGVELRRNQRSKNHWTPRRLLPSENQPTTSRRLPTTAPNARAVARAETPRLPRPQGPPASRK
jgi:hypothetical protein